MPDRSASLYLNDIKEAINKIERYTKTISREGFATDEKTIDAVIRNLGTIGEAANNIPQDMKERHNDIPWKQMIGMRNKVIHEYFGVDWEILYKTIEEDIPLLKKQMESFDYGAEESLSGF